MSTLNDWNKLRRPDMQAGLFRAEMLLKALRVQEDPGSPSYFGIMAEAVETARRLLSSPTFDRRPVTERFAYPSEQRKHGAMPTEFDLLKESEQ